MIPAQAQGDVQASGVQVTVDRVSKGFGPVLALNDVSLAFGAGTHGIVGPNGAGKSTLLSLLTGLARPTLGRVRVLGEDPHANPRVLRRLGFAPETEAHYDGLSARAFLRAMGALSGLPASRARARADEALADVDLADVAGRALGAMSRGMRQRVKLAQAILHDPEILVLDEPLTGMDPLARRIVTALLRRLGRRGRTIVVSSHVLHEVEALTDRIFLLRHGRLLAEGTVREIRSLIIRHPLQVRVDSPRIRDLAAQAAGWEEVVTVHLDDRRRRLTAEVTRADRFLGRLGDLALDGFPIEAIDTPDESLEAIFRYLVLERGAGGEEAEG